MKKALIVSLGILLSWLGLFGGQAQAVECSVYASANVTNPSAGCRMLDYAVLNGPSGSIACPANFVRDNSDCRHPESGTLVASWLQVDTPTLPTPRFRERAVILSADNNCSGRFCRHVQMAVFHRLGACSGSGSFTFLGWAVPRNVTNRVSGATQIEPTSVQFAPQSAKAACYIFGRWGGGNGYPNIRLHMFPRAR